LAIADAGDPRYLLNTGGDDVLRLDPDDRIAAGEHLRNDLAAYGRTAGEDVMAHEPDDVHEVARQTTLDPERDVTGVATSQPGGMTRRDIEGDVTTRVARTHDQHAARTQLAGIAVLTGVQLHDAWVKFGRERGAPRRAEGSGRHHNVVRRAAPLPGAHDEVVTLPA